MADQEKERLTRQAAIIAQSLEPHEVKALRILFKASIGSFEKLSGMPGIREPMVDRLAELGLAEKGTANTYTGAIGYRTTALGTAVFSALDKRPRKPSPKINALPSRIATLPPRLKTLK
ncbi:hypothetical protein [Oryzicola mucosus]|uniref:Uncharacterized protein n=1 Tax=Oryzicola mucosus TaxID=2767425 RepID=A0A8J6PKN5_9HYPH|nr:hypothetical protein [Oryzicola mucosus]MBD0416133.1 hypothetical protein [Oryzicola mucosus]